MAKKYYAVRVGKVPGVYQTWEECKKNVHGFPAPEYKSFMSIEEANAYMGREAVQEINGKTGSGNMEDVMPDDVMHLLMVLLILQQECMDMAVFLCMMVKI